MTHLTQRAVLGDKGIKNWYMAPGTPEKTAGILTFEQRPTRIVSLRGCVAEPTLHGANREYFVRRQRDIFEDGVPVYRPSIRVVPPAMQVERTDRRRFIPQPHPEQHVPYGGIRQFPQDTKQPANPSRLPEPEVYRLRRSDPLATCLRQDPKEVVFEQELGRKYNVHPELYRRTGRAGDLTIRSGSEPRNEEQKVFFATLKDTPSFLRYVASLPPKAASSPHQRRAQWEAKQKRSETQSDRALVSTLKD